MKRGLFKAAELGSTRLVDYFLAHQVDINSVLKINVIHFQHSIHLSFSYYFILFMH